jgi:cytochrome P450
MRATTIVFFQHLRPLLQYLLPFSPSRRFLETHSKNVETLLSKRMDIDSDRKDFAFYALETQKIGDPRSLMTRSELLACFEVFMVAGSDTTTSALSACM